MPSLQLVTASDALVDGKYRLLDVIGSGGVGTVYRATHVWTEREVAVKVLHSDLPYLTELRAAFLREARAAVKLEHPNVVDVLDMGEDAAGTTYMVMELLEGPTLRDVLSARGSLSSDETVVVLAPLIDALEKAHQIGIVHKDFKPENIILTTKADGSVVPTLLDFGVAQILRDSHGEGEQEEVLIGTPQYMSPEQARGQRDAIGPHSDVWGVGVVWYECLTGVCPFDGDTHSEALDAVIHGPLDLDELREPHSGLLAGMLRRRIAERTPDLSALRDEMIRAGVIERASREESATFRLPAPGARPSRILATLQGVGPAERKRLSSPPRSDTAEVEALPKRSSRASLWMSVGLAAAIGFAAWWSTTRIEDARNLPLDADVISEVPSRLDDDVSERTRRSLDTEAAHVRALPYAGEDSSEETVTPLSDPPPDQSSTLEDADDATEAPEEAANAAPTPLETAGVNEDADPVEGSDAVADTDSTTPPTSRSSTTGKERPAKRPVNPARKEAAPASTKSYQKPPDLVTEW